ncbi:glucosaminidase domain-containing protein [Pseudomaricurvus sp. HS19]|uniref:glucosaminidase domain-containing protein n=1 Tax=Pseudomaricurvus sp. HS19 TaxID=2692626 RepID=UPI00136D6E33|nr:glucosaminidase domain-containing protein [Pseudomaricurvus sp. HS19]
MLPVSPVLSLKKLWFLLLTVLLAGCFCEEICLNCEVELPRQSSLSSAQLRVPDFTAFEVVADKKSAFFGFLMPLVDKVNREVLLERNRLRALAFSTLTPGKRDREFVAQMCEKYRYDCSEESLKERALALSERIGMVPPSLALGQAANESAWGTSRFARNGNNYFGQWCFVKGCGLVPTNRHSRARHEVRRFASPLASVRSYIHNLNSSPAYEEFRRLRAAARAAGDVPSGLQLAQGLQSYSERGRAYIQEIRAMISVNELGHYDLEAWQELGAQVVPRA